MARGALRPARERKARASPSARTARQAPAAFCASCDCKHRRAPAARREGAHSACHTASYADEGERPVDARARVGRRHARRRSAQAEGGAADDLCDCAAKVCVHVRVCVHAEAAPRARQAQRRGGGVSVGGAASQRHVSDAAQRRRSGAAQHAWGRVRRCTQPRGPRACCVSRRACAASRHVVCGCVRRCLATKGGRGPPPARLTPAAPLQQPPCAPPCRPPCGWASPPPGAPCSNTPARGRRRTT